MIRGILIAVSLGVVIAAAIQFVGFTDRGRIDALFSRCFWRGGVEITRSEVPGPAAYECFKDGNIIDSYHTVS